MSRYVDAAKVYESARKHKDFAQNLADLISLLEVLKDTPTADVAAVKHGKWITDDDGIVICSECGEEHDWDDFRPPYCDICGAKMDGDEK